MSNATSPDVPLDAPSPDIVIERSVFYGTIFMSLSYGLCIYMYFHSLSLYVSFQKQHRKQYRLYIVVGTASVLLITVAVFTNVVLAQYMWIDHRDFEGGPLGYLVASTSVWWQIFGTACDMVANFIGDGLLIYRCYIIWHGSWLIITFPILLYLGSIATALITLVQSARPGDDFFSGLTVNFGVPWAALSVSLNVFVTVIISTRLMRARQLLKGIMPKESLSLYTGITAILIESCLPFSVLGIIFAVTYGKSLDIASAFIFIWGVFVSLAPQFIIFRVMNGKSWTTDIVSQATTGNWSTTHNRDQPIAFRAGSASVSKATSRFNTSTTGSNIEVQMHTATQIDQKESVV